MKALRPILAALLFCAGFLGTNGRLQASDAEPPLYLVLFRLTAGADGRFQDLQAIKVIDLLSGSNNAVAVELPQAFLDQARKRVQAENMNSIGPDGRPAGDLASFLYVPDDGKPGSSAISFGLFNGVIGTVINFRLLDQGAALSAFGTNYGGSAFFVSYYALGSLPKATAEQRAAIIEAEIQRGTANFHNARILSHRDLSTDAQTIVEVTCKSPANRALTLRARYLCNDRQVLALTAITPDGSPTKDIQAVEQLFDAFRFR